MLPKQYHTALLLLAMVVAAASQGAWLVGGKKHPTLADHCYDDEHDLSIKVNEMLYPTNFPGECFKIFCREDFVLQINQCQRGTHSCDKKVDYRQPFPKCCSNFC